MGGTDGLSARGEVALGVATLSFLCPRPPFRFRPQAKQLLVEGRVRLLSCRSASSSAGAVTPKSDSGATPRAGIRCRVSVV